MSDQFETYRRRLAGEDFDFNVDEIHSGYFRTKQFGTYVPVATWINGDGQRVFRVGKDVITDPLRQWEIFITCKPMPVDAVKQAFETGNWPGDAEHVLGDDAPAHGEIGHNSGETEPTVRERILEAFDRVRAWSKKMPETTDKTLADTAANVDTRLLQLEKEAKAERDAVVKPKKAEIKSLNERVASLKGEVKAVEEEWKPLLEKIAPAREVCKKVYIPWQREQSIQFPDDPKAWQCGGQFGKAVGYYKDRDQEHPENIAAREAAERERERMERERHEAAERERIARDLAEKQRREEEARARAEADAKRAAEAKAKPAPEPDLLAEPEKPAPEAPIIGAEIIKWSEAFSHYFDHPGVRDAVRRAATTDIKAGKNLPFAKAVRGNFQEAAE